MIINIYVPPLENLNISNKIQRIEGSDSLQYTGNNTMDRLLRKKINMENTGFEQHFQPNGPNRYIEHSIQ
jgi:hypothetical protein